MDNLKQQSFDYIDSLSAELFSLGEKLLNSPELGFKEQQTRSIMLEKIQQLEQVSLRDNLAITGFSAIRINPQAKRTIALLAEMDAVFQPQHFCAAKDGASEREVESDGDLVCRAKFPHRHESVVQGEEMERRAYAQSEAAQSVFEALRVQARPDAQAGQFIGLR